MFKGVDYLKIIKGYWKILLIAVIGGGLLFSWWWKDSNASQEVVLIKVQSFKQTISVSGESKAASFVDLAFEQGGKIASVRKEVGDRVAVGDVLVALESGTVRANLLSAEANLEYEQAKLADSKVGLSDASRELQDSLRDAYTKADDAIRNHGDRVFADPNSVSARFEISFNDNGRQITFDLNDANLKSTLGDERRNLNQILTDWKNDINDPAFLADPEKAVKLTQDRLGAVRKLLDNVSLAVNSLGTIYYQYQSTLDSYKADISTARTNVDNASAAVTSSKREWNNANLSVGDSLNRPSAQLAQIKQAEAKVAEQQALLSKFTLASPLNGVVTKQEAKVGAQVTAGTVVTSVIATDSFEIEANIPEINIGKIKVGQPTTITFDAYPGREFSGKVFYIDPAETIVDGVVNYKIKVSLDKVSDEIKSGLTANLSIITLPPKEAVVVPVYALSSSKGKMYVDKEVNSKAIKTEITVGAYGDDGLVEVLGGLKPGDKILAAKK